MKKLALLSALSLMPFAATAAQAEIINLHLFPLGDRTVDTTVEPATIVAPTAVTAPVIQSDVITQPAVIEPAATVTQTSSVSVSAPPLTDLQIKAMPTTLDRGSVTVDTTTTLPAVIEPACGSCGAVAPVVQERSFSAVIPPLSVGSAVLGLNAMDRLTDMMDQVRLGGERGMISSDVSSSLTAEHDRIAALINSLAPGGFTMDEVNQVETQLNLFNQRISQSMGG